MTTEPAGRPDQEPVAQSIAQSDPSAGNAAFTRPALALALMTITAGLADGFALSRFDVFVANQSGNVVRLGMALVGSFTTWGVTLGAVLGFMAGGAVSWAVRRTRRNEPRSTAGFRLAATLALTVVAGATVAAGAGPLVFAVVASAAMGVLATVLTHIGSVPTQPGFQSANVLATAEGALDWLFRTDPAGRRGRLLASIAAMTVLCYVAGGALGALAERGAGMAAFLGLLPLVVCLGLIARARAPR